MAEVKRLPLPKAHAKLLKKRQERLASRAMQHVCASNLEFKTLRREEHLEVWGSFLRSRFGVSAPARGSAAPDEKKEETHTNLAHFRQRFEAGS